jgi:hypothetical protein
MPSVSRSFAFERTVQDDRARKIRLEIFLGIVVVLGVIIALAAMRYSRKPKLASTTTTSSTESEHRRRSRPDADGLDPG